MTQISDQQIQQIQQMTAAIVSDQQAYDQSLTNQLTLEQTISDDNDAVATAQAQVIVDTDAYNTEVSNGLSLQQQVESDIEALDSFIQSLFPATVPAPAASAAVVKK